MEAISGRSIKPGLTAKLSVPGSAGSIATYTQTINRFPVLSLAEEQAYARRLRHDNDVEAAGALVLSHLRLVVSIARGFLGYGLPQSDLIQEGNIGLMKSVNRFDPERGVRLATFASHWIKAAIHEYVLRNWRLVRIAGTKAQRKLFFNLRSMKSRPGALRGKDISRIAGTLKVKPREVVEMEVRLSGEDIAFEADHEDNFSAPAQYLTEQRDEPSGIIEREEIERLCASSIKTAVARLDPRSRRVIESRWLAGTQRATLLDLATEFKVSAERIRQIESAALAKLRTAMSG